MPASTQLTISTLTTAAPSDDIDDEEELFARGEGGNESEEDKEEEIPPPKMHLKTVNNGKDEWECGWCGKMLRLYFGHG
jgi:hypothetical protein